MIHLYAFAANLKGLPTRGGIGDGPLETLALHRATAVVSRVNAEADASRRSVVEHGLVVEALVDIADAVLPVRFGERFADKAAVLEAGSRLEPELGSRLDRVGGCVEIGVRVVDRSPARRLDASNGGSYMRSRLLELRARDAVAGGLHAALEREARASVVGRADSGAILHVASYLVERRALQSFRERVARYAQDRPELTVVCTGPWAPYSFSGGGGAT